MPQNRLTVTTFSMPHGKAVYFGYVGANAEDGVALERAGLRTRRIPYRKPF